MQLEKIDFNILKWYDDKNNLYKRHIKLMQGKAFNPDPAEFSLVAYKYQGCIRLMADYFNINEETMHRFFKRNPEVRHLVNDIIDFNSHNDNDYAETVVRLCMKDYKKDSRTALSAARFVLENKGKERGYGKTEREEQRPPREEILDLEDEVIRLKNENRLLKNDLESKTGTELP